MSLPLRPEDYYDYFPGVDHYPGDIWAGLPTFGAAPQRLGSGIVVTPACDLANSKVESITYLPIVAVRSFLLSPSLLPEFKRAIAGQLQSAGLNGIETFPLGHAYPRVADIEALRLLIAEKLAETRIPLKVKSALQRADAGLQVLEACCTGAHSDHLSARTTELFGAGEHSKLVESLVRNSRAGTHFLPADGQREAWSAVPKHSLALLRFPLSIPIQILDLAQQSAAEEWSALSANLAPALPSLEFFPTRPLKCIRLQPRFAADLLTRFTGMFGRLGSPDFTAATVQSILTQIGDLP